jgi:hypothetical protein
MLLACAGDSDYWTNGELMNDSIDNEFRIDRDEDGKFAGFIHSPADEIRGCLQGHTPDGAYIYYVRVCLLPL